MCNYNKEVGDLDCRGAGVRKSIQEVALKLGPKLSLLLRKQENRIKRIDSDCFTKITEVDSKYQNPHTRPRRPQLSRPFVTFRLTFVCFCMSRCYHGQEYHCLVDCQLISRRTMGFHRFQYIIICNTAFSTTLSETFPYPRTAVVLPVRAHIREPSGTTQWASLLNSPAQCSTQ